MKKFLSIFIVLCSLLSLLVPAASATNEEISDIAWLQADPARRAVVETMLAYYYKGNDVQYDSYRISAGTRYGSTILRQTNNRQPEDASADDTLYTVCSAYPHDVYYATFGKHVIDSFRQKLIERYTQQLNPYLNGANLMEGQLAYEYGIQNDTDNYIALGKYYDENKNNSSEAANINALNGMVVGYWGPNDDGSTTCENADAAAVREMMRPGDIIATHVADRSATGDEDGTVDEAGGHTMMFLGDIFGDKKDYIIHSAGDKYDDAGEDEIYYNAAGEELTGIDRLEAPGTWGHKDGDEHYSRNGSISIAPYDAFLGTEGDFCITNCYDFTILRPVQVMAEADMTDSAKFRVHHPGLVVTKTASVKPYNDVVKGQEITYTIEIENNTVDTVNAGKIGTTNRYGAAVNDTAETSYSNLVITETLPEGTSLASESLRFTVDSLAPGETKTVEYMVTVDGSTSQIVSPAGTVTVAGCAGALQTKELTHEVVGRHLTDNIDPKVTASTAAPRSGMDVAEDIYTSLDLPDGQKLVDMLTKKVPFSSSSEADVMLLDAADLTGTARNLRDMIVPGFVGGKRLHTADENGVRTNENRLLMLDQKFFQPGDILVYLNTAGGTNLSIASEKAYVYLGSDKWAHYEDGNFTTTYDPVVTYYGAKNTYFGTIPGGDMGSHISGAGKVTNNYSSRKYSHSKIFHQCFLQDLFFVLRPSRVGLTDVAATSTAKAVEVNGTWYNDLTSAISAATAGGTITLHEDVVLSQKAELTGVTIDLNGHTIFSTSTTDDTLSFSGTGNVLKNGTVEGTVYAGSSASLTLQDMTLLGKDLTYTPVGSSYARKGYALFSSGAATVTLDGVSMASEYAAGAPWATTNNNFKNISIEDDVKILIPSGVTWNPGSLSLNGTTKYTGTAKRSLDGTIVGGKATVNYTCVTYTKSPDVYNETQDKYYPSLTEAFRKIAANDTLMLLRDVNASDFDEVAMRSDATGKSTYLLNPNKKNVTVDLNGKTITDKVSTSAPFYNRSCTLTVKNGKFISGGTAAFNAGNLVLEDLEVSADGSVVELSSTGDENQEALIKDCVLISGAKSGKNSPVLSVRRGKATVRDSKLYSNGAQPLSAGVQSDYTGTILLEKAVVAMPMYTYNALGTTVKGTAEGNSIEVAADHELASTRQPLTYNYDGVPMTFLADIYDVTDAAAVATVNGENFTSVEQALKKAESGKTVTVTANANISGNITIPAGVTLAASEKSVSLTNGATLTVRGIVTGNVDDTDGTVILEGDGSYLGITIPEFVTAETVYADQDLNGEYTITVGSTLEITGISDADHAAVQVWKDGKQTDLNGEEFTIGTVAAKHMNDEIEVVLVADGETGTYVGKTETICIRSCAEAALKTATGATRRALIALLDYGAAAQTYFDYDTGNLANKNITDRTGAVADTDLADEKSDNSSLSGKDTSLIYGTCCVLGEDLRMRMYFYAPDITGLTFQVSYKDVTKTVTPTAATDEGYYFVTLEDLSIADYATDVTVTVSNADGVQATGTDSVRSYLARFREKNAPMSNAILAFAWAVANING